MKNLVWISLMICILLLTGCGNKNQGETTVTESTSENSVLTATLPLDDLEIYAPTEGESSDSTEAQEMQILAVLDIGRYDGMFVEDGSDDAVEDVACILVQNTTEQYLDYGVISAAVGGKDCSFVVTGLPGGACAWVLEKDRCVMDANGVYEYKDDSVSQLRDVSKEDERVKVELRDGKIVVSNLSGTDLSSVRIYYKRIHDDGNFLGGITYTTAAENLKAGESTELTAGHSTETGCAVVRLDITE